MSQGEFLVNMDDLVNRFFGGAPTFPTSLACCFHCSLTLSERNQFDRWVIDLPEWRELVLARDRHQAAIIQCYPDNDLKDRYQAIVDAERAIRPLLEAWFAGACARREEDAKRLEEEYRRKESKP